ncbi:Sec7 domain-containing protein [Cardiosporidium cionae]|uniref:Sec7 domain-containing protein n=1 Tax=Cardiosporidium cionae TaxID=476202 RepID=A0ABQ7JAF2_9APIC|nr:Sec7 domain-containing protein [Cardiosporidium cionae]|eukprot:KAF8820923.1 Sec7 domain-containing protein [Cardiosporidium cionae]
MPKYRGQTFEAPRTPTMWKFWCEGIPPGLRGKIWAIAIGNDQRITPDLFRSLLGKAARIRHNSNVNTTDEKELQEKLNFCYNEIPNAWSRLFAISSRTLQVNDSKLPLTDVAALPDLGMNIINTASIKTVCKMECNSAKNCDHTAERVSNLSEVVSAKTGNGAKGEHLSENLTFICRNDDGNDEKERNKEYDVRCAKGKSGDAMSELEERIRVNNENDEASSKIQLSLIRLNQLLKDSQDILSAFCVYRPEIGYMRGLGNLAVILSFYMQSTVAFQAFVNLVYSNHFMDFLLLSNGSYRRRVRMRFDFFQVAIAEQAFPWFGNYTRFVLDGLVSDPFYQSLTSSSAVTRVGLFSTKRREFAIQSFAFEAALAILRYHERSLLTNSFEGCIKILNRNAHPLEDDYGVFDDKIYFKVVSDANAIEQ